MLTANTFAAATPVSRYSRPNTRSLLGGGQTARHFRTPCVPTIEEAHARLPSDYDLACLSATGRSPSIYVSSPLTVSPSHQITLVFRDSPENKRSHDASTRVPSSMGHVLWACPSPATSLSHSRTGSTKA